jgi:Fe-S-cluster-containing hydrogenase component 2
MPAVVQHKCPQNHPCPCVRICPVDAVRQEGFDAPKIDETKCIECGECVRFCPYQAITDISLQENASFL